MSQRVSILALLTLASTAHADAVFKPVPARPAPTPAPVVKIVSPEVRASFITHKTAVTHPWDTAYPCLMDVRDRRVQVALENWTVAPGGNGVAIVIDNEYGIVVHDVSKPIAMDAIVPYVEESPEILQTCGWHWVAAFAVDKDGVAVKTPNAVAVAPFFNRAKLEQDDFDMMDDATLKQPLLVMNLPYLGKQNPKPANQPETHYVSLSSATPKLDYVIWNGATAKGRCNLRVRADRLEGQPDFSDVGLALSTGTLALEGRKHSDDRDDIEWDLTCENGAGYAYWHQGAVHVSDLPPTKVVSRPWPIFNGKNASRTDYWQTHQGELHDLVNKACVKDPTRPGCRP